MRGAESPRTFGERGLAASPSPTAASVLGRDAACVNPRERSSYKDIKPSGDWSQISGNSVQKIWGLYKLNENRA